MFFLPMFQIMMEMGKIALKLPVPKRQTQEKVATVELDSYDEPKPAAL